MPTRANVTQTLRSIFAGLCILLILITGAAQLLHTHAGPEATDSGCSLCAVAHLSVLTVSVLTQPVTTEAVLTLRTAETQLTPFRRFFFATYVRPPPSLTLHS